MQTYEMRETNSGDVATEGFFLWILVQYKHLSNIY